MGFSLNIIKLPVLKRYANAGILLWEDVTERIEWNYVGRELNLPHHFLGNILLSSCDFAWATPSRSPTLLAYVFLHPRISTEEVQVLAFEASLTATEDLVFRAHPSHIPMKLPGIGRLDFMGSEAITQSTLVFLRGTKRAPIAPEVGRATVLQHIGVHIGLDENAELYFRYCQLSDEEGAERYIAYLGDAYSGTIIYRTKKGIHIVRP